MKKNNRKGFTIVELVIVIAVIAILSAILIPTFSNLVADANETAALSQARNMYTKYVSLNIADGNVEEDLVFEIDDNTYVVYSDGVLVETVYTSATLEASEYKDYTKVTSDDLVEVEETTAEETTAA